MQLEALSLKTASSLRKTRHNRFYFHRFIVAFFVVSALNILPAQAEECRDLPQKLVLAFQRLPTGVSASKAWKKIQVDEKSSAGGFLSQAPFEEFPDNTPFESHNSLSDLSLKCPPVLDRSFVVGPTSLIFTFGSGTEDCSQPPLLIWKTSDAKGHIEPLEPLAGYDIDAVWCNNPYLVLGVSKNGPKGDALALLFFHLDKGRWRLFPVSSSSLAGLKDWRGAQVASFSEGLGVVVKTLETTLVFWPAQAEWGETISTVQRTLPVKRTRPRTRSRSILPKGSSPLPRRLTIETHRVLEVAAPDMETLLFLSSSTTPAETETPSHEGLPELSQMPIRSHLLLEIFLTHEGRIKTLAAQGLGDQGSSAAGAAPYLIESLADPDERLRAAVMNALADIGPEAIPALIQTLEKASPEAQKASEVLVRLGPPAIPALVNLVSRPWGRGRRFAVDALGATGPAASQAVPILIHLFDDSDKILRDKAVDALGGIGVSAMPALLPLLQSSSWQTRMYSLRALGRIGQPAAKSVPWLMQNAKHSQPEVRAAALEALGFMSFQPEHRAAIENGRKDKHPLVRQSAEKALMELMGHAPPPRRALDPWFTGATRSIMETVVDTISIHWYLAVFYVKYSVREWIKGL